MRSIYCVPCKGWYIWVGGPRPVCPFCRKPTDDPLVPYVLTVNDRRLLRSFRITPDDGPPGPPPVLEEDGA